MLDKVLNRTMVLEKTLDAGWARNEAISNNIANVDTPAYRRKSVEFEDMLSQAMDKNSIKGYRTDPRHIPIGSSAITDVGFKIVEDSSSLNYRLDGNNVDIEKEMALMAKNTIQYNTVTQKLAGEFKKLKSVISEGRR
ncbi:MAG: flgB [Clostridiales bacterium]|jgi:flagellar basal-body rod protein FlgB|nr:flgB [Clostridiales bacterium]